MDAIMNFNLDGQTTKGLLIYLQELYIELLKEHSDLLEEKKITSNFRNMLRLIFRRQSL